MNTDESLRKMLAETCGVIRSRIDFEPKIGIIMGTGLGSLVDGMELVASVGYEELPHFPVSTVESHAGKLLFGHLKGKPVVCMQGRFHYYEGYSFRQITLPIRVMKALGMETLIASNAAGGLNPQFAEGDIMLVTDHINFFPGNPLIGPNDDDLGPRFPDMFEVYDRRYLQLAREAALDQKLLLKEGVYIGVTGPTLETAAEYRFFRFAGADAVGMSTIPEVIVARHQGSRVLAFSMITDMGLADNIHPCNIESVLAVAAATEPKMRRLIAGCVERM